MAEETVTHVFCLFSCRLFSLCALRTLDSLPGTMEVLRDVVEAVGEQVEVFVDGGIMTGQDVFKALAYG